MNNSEVIKNVFYLHKMGLNIEHISLLVQLEEEQVRAILFWKD